MATTTAASNRPPGPWRALRSPAACSASLCRSATSSTAGVVAPRPWRYRGDADGIGGRLAGLLCRTHRRRGGETCPDHCYPLQHVRAALVIDELATFGRERLDSFGPLRVLTLAVLAGGSSRSADCCPCCSPTGSRHRARSASWRAWPSAPDSSSSCSPRPQDCTEEVPDPGHCPRRRHPPGQVTGLQAGRREHHVRLGEQHGFQHSPAVGVLTSRGGGGDDRGNWQAYRAALAMAVGHRRSDDGTQNRNAE